MKHPMRLLLDTHVALWALWDSPRLSQAARGILLDPANTVFLSSVSLLEVELKHIAHPREMRVNARELAELGTKAGYLRLALSDEHVFGLGALTRRPGTPTHKDPFDRLLISQATAEGMRLVTHDARIAEYESPCVLPV